MMALIFISVVASFFCCKRADYDFYAFVDSCWAGKNENEFEIDFAKMDCKWDTLWYYSKEVPVNYINEKHGVCFKDKISVWSRLVVLYKSKVVSTQEYNWECSGIYPTIIFCLGDSAVITSEDARFNVNKLGKEFYIEKMK
ncbi:MAG: hypothetical protein E7087_07750 [Bacteroidales bacterium]|nr:hypothetical protein [Bacteroidales bacterium]MBO5263975.1 hypothetical protein [Bacteroidaceae bacterium]